MIRENLIKKLRTVYLLYSSKHGSYERQVCNATFELMKRSRFLSLEWKISP